MDPWHDILEGGGSPDNHSDARSALTHIARYLTQMGVIHDFEPSALPPPASKNSVEALAKETLEKNSDMKCSICLRELCAGDTQVTMPCKHVFHDECILAWLNKTNSCPVCRHELPTDDALYERFKQEQLRQESTRQNLATLHASMFS